MDLQLPSRPDGEDSGSVGGSSRASGILVRPWACLDFGHADPSRSDRHPEHVSTTASSSRSSHTAGGLNASGGDLDANFEQLLQALLLNQGLLEDHGPDGLPATWGGNVVVPSRPGTTLRDMRRTGPLGELSQDAQTTLLGGTLYEYGERAEPPLSHGRLQPRTSGLPESNISSRIQSRAGTARNIDRCVGETGLDGRLPTHIGLDSQQSSGPVSPRLQANQARHQLLLEDLLRQSLERVLQLSTRQGAGVADSSIDVFPAPSASQAAAVALGFGPDSSSPLHSGRSVAALQVATGSALNTSRSSRSGLSSVGGLPSMDTLPAASRDQVSSCANSARESTTLQGRPPQDNASPGQLRQQESTPLVVVASPARSFGGAVGSDDLQASLSRDLELEESDGDDGVVSVVGFSSRPMTAGSEPSSVGGRRQSNAGLDETTSVWGLGDTIQSSSSTARSESQSLQQSSRGLSGMNFDGGDGGLTNLLHRLALDNLSLDESLTRSVQRVLQLGTVLTGQRLSDDEICALPKVRFDQAEQQNCAICLEAYQQGEFLTSLRCNHFFHVDCLARWFRRSTQCPLCRQDCGGI